MTGRLEFFSTPGCASTNTAIWDYLDSAPCVLTTDNQTQGRGRGGRSWLSNSEGSLVFSFLEVPNKNIKNLDNYLRWVPLVSGICIYESLSRLSHLLLNTSLPETLYLKWPNDIFNEDKKLGGVLCESRFLGNQCQGTVIGIGLNLWDAPRSSGLNIETCDLLDDFSLSLETKLNFKQNLIKELGSSLLNTLTDLEDCNFDINIFRNRWIKYSQIKSRPNLKTHHKDSFDKKNYRIIDLDVSGKLLVEDSCANRIFLDQAF